MIDPSLSIGPFVESPPWRALTMLGFVVLTTTLSGPIVRFFTEPLKEAGDDVARPDAERAAAPPAGPAASPRATRSSAAPSLGEGRTPRRRRFRASTVIGKCENVLVLALVFVGEITGLAIIFAAKSLVRREDIQQDAGYFLGGTLVNTVWAFFMGIALRAVVLGI